jgi:hypothetical protein
MKSTSFLSPPDATPLDDAVFSSSLPVRRIEKNFLVKLVEAGVRISVGAGKKPARVSARIKPRAVNPEDVMHAIDSGVLDHLIGTNLETVQATPARMFTDVRPFDVADWAERKGISPPSTSRK